MDLKKLVANEIHRHVAEHLSEEQVYGLLEKTEARRTWGYCLPSVFFSKNFP